MVDETVEGGARLRDACELLGLSPRTIARWREKTVDGRTIRKHTPANRLSDEEIAKIVELLQSPEFKGLPPSQIVPTLADRGDYLASESTLYRILRKRNMNAHRLASRPARHRAPESFVATGPNQVWSWDITYLPTTVRGRFFYLYMVCDIYSRKIVAWEIHDGECSEHSARLIHKACLREGVKKGDLVLHSDNGSPMKGATMLATLQRLGVIPSFSRPSVSNDNPFSEALFRTLKYTPDYPLSPFQTLESAQQWVLGFTVWYNNAHRHSALKFVTPQQRHQGRDRDILAHRTSVYTEARNRHPERWSRSIRDWSPILSTELNPRKKGKAMRPEPAVADSPTGPCAEGSRIPAEAPNVA